MDPNIYGDFQICISVPLKVHQKFLFVSKVLKNLFLAVDLTILCLSTPVETARLTWKNINLPKIFLGESWEYFSTKEASSLRQLDMI